MRIRTSGHTEGPGHNNASLHHSGVVHAAHLHASSTDLGHEGGAKVPDRKQRAPPRHDQGGAALLLSHSMPPPAGHYLLRPFYKLPVHLHNVDLHRHGHLVLTNSIATEMYLSVETP